MDDQLRSDFAIDALVLEVDRRKTQMPCGRYSYGKLVADTSREERQRIADRYRKGGKRAVLSAGKYREQDDQRDLQKVAGTVEG